MKRASQLLRLRAAVQRSGGVSAERTCLSQDAADGLVVENPLSITDLGSDQSALVNFNGQVDGKRAMLPDALAAAER
jgi:hypothetical protein